MLTAHQVEEITTCLPEYYPIGPVRSLMPMHFPVIDPILAHHGSNVWRVDAQLGAFCLKRHRPGKPLSRIQFEQDLQGRISQAARNMVPDPMKTLNGSSHFSIDEDWFRLERFVRSQHHAWWRQDWNVDHCRTAGRALREFHRLTRGFMQQTPDWLPVSGTACGVSNGAYVAGFGPLGSSVGHGMSIALVQARAGVTSQNPQFTESVLACVDACAELLSRSENLIAALPEPAMMLLVHGDYHPGNLLFVGEELKAIVDFEHVHLEDPLFDVGYAALMFATSWTEPPAETHDFDRDFLSALLEGYGDVDGQPLGTDMLAKHLVTACILVASWLLARCPVWQADNPMPLDCLQHSIGCWRRSLSRLGC
jgi:Ser/Thr protein kinase RdoA (MazF antagonist)